VRERKGERNREKEREREGGRERERRGGERGRGRERERERENMCVVKSFICNFFFILSFTLIRNCLAQQKTCN